MNSYNPAHLPNDLNVWLQSRYMSTISAVEGGWEYWMQIDFMAWLNTRQKDPYDVRREVPMGPYRADLFLNRGPDGEEPALRVFPPCWVEIKAQGAKYLNEKFKVDVQADIDKMAGAGVPCEQYMLVALSDGNLTRDPMFARGSGYGFVWQDAYTGVVVLLKRTA